MYTQFGEQFPSKWSFSIATGCSRGKVHFDFNTSASSTALLCDSSFAPKNSVSVPCSLSIFFKFEIRSFFFLSSARYFILELHPFPRFGPEPLAKRITWRHFLHPQIDVGRLLFHTSRPQAIHQDAPAVLLRWLLVNSLHLDHLAGFGWKPYLLANARRAPRAINSPPVAASIARRTPLRVIVAFSLCNALL